MGPITRSDCLVRRLPAEPGPDGDLQQLINLFCLALSVGQAADWVKVPLPMENPAACQTRPFTRGAYPLKSLAFTTTSSSSLNVWSTLAVGVALIVCMPVLAVIWLAFNPEQNIWPHLIDTVLLQYIITTLGLMLGVAAGTLLLGVSTAWLVTHYEFPARRWFNWALLLPFAVPAYVIAYVYTDLLEFAGPVQTTLRATFGWKLANEYWFPSIRSLPGAIIMMSLVLYPYVYLLSRAAFLEQSASVLEAARVLGGNSRGLFLKVALPMARPAIAVGLAMALMETLNDYGTVDYFAVRTLTAGLYDVWLGKPPTS